MERADRAVGLGEETGSSDETARRAFSAGRRNMEKETVMKSGFEQSPLLRAVKRFIERLQHSRLARQCAGGANPRACGALAAALARAEGSAPNNPYALYAPGRYIRGC